MKSVKSLKMKIFMVIFVVGLYYKTLATTVFEAKSLNGSSININNILSQQVAAVLPDEKEQSVSSSKSDDKKFPFFSNVNRRRSVNQWKSKAAIDDCEKNCRAINNDEYCKVKCYRDMKVIESDDLKLKAESNEMSTRDSNLVQQQQQSSLTNDEESVIEAVGTNIELMTKNNTNNTINSNNNDAYTKDIPINNRTRTTTTTKVNRRKYTRTSLFLTNQTRPTIYRGRVKYSPSNFRPIKEESEDPYLHQVKSTRRYTDTRKIVPTRRIPLPSSTQTKSKEEELEIMEVSVAKQSSTEKNKFWKTRNIVAINNYMRKLNSQLNLLSTVPKTLNDDDSVTPRSSTISYDQLTPKKNYTLLINIPDDASPVFHNDERNYQQSDGEYENNTKLLEALMTTSSSTTTEIPNINHLFENISSTTSSNKNIIFEQNETPIFTSTTSKATKKIYTAIPRRKTSATTTTTTTQSTTSSLPSSTTTTAKSTQIFSTSEIISSTISSFLNNVSPARREKSEATTTSLAHKPPPKFTSTSTTTTTIKYLLTNTKVPFIIDQIRSDFPLRETTTIKTTATTTAKSTTRINNINEVFVEPQKLNYTTVYYVLGAIVLVPAILFLIYVTKQHFIRNEHKANDSEHYGNDVQPISPVVTFDHSDTCSDGEESIITESGLNRNKLRFKSLLGEGNFGQVWKAEIDDLPGFLGTTKIVAVKTERAINRCQGGLKAECEIMRKLGTHPNVVKLIAGCTAQEPHLLIMEFAMRGRLLSLLRTARSISNSSNHNMQNHHQAALPLSPHRLTCFAHDIAKGMEYISEKRIVHGDLAARNILLDHNGVCKICDFGMSIDLDKTKKSSENQMKIPRVSTHKSNFKFDMTTRVFDGIKNYAFSKTRNNNANIDLKNRHALPVRWMAPEALKFHIYSVETDIFAFGILLWEISTFGITPYPTLSGRQVIRGVMNGLRPEMPKNCNEDLSNVMQQCWNKETSLRPSFSDIRKTLAIVLLNWQEEPCSTHTEYLDVSGFSEDYENGMIYFNRRISEFECEI